MVTCLLAFLSLPLVLGAPPAQAARVHPLEASEALPVGSPFAVAIDQNTHHIYVVTSDGSGHHGIYNLEEDGSLDPVHPELTGASLPSPFGIAVDNSGDAHTGYIYVVDRAGILNPVGAVQQFGQEGGATSVTITEAAIPANGSAQTGGLPSVVNTGTFEPRRVAVDDAGDILVTDSAARAIDVFDPEGAFVRQVAGGVIGEFPTGIATDGPDVYLSEGGGARVGLTEFDAATGECIPAACTPIDPARISGVAVDQATGTVFTSGLVSSEDGSEGKFSEYEAATGDLLGVTRPQALHSPEGIAVDETSGTVTVADTLPAGEGTLKIFGGVKTVPDVVTKHWDEVTDRTATLKGEIGAAGVAGGATCVFQYVPQERFEADGFEGAPTAPCEPGGPFSGEALNAVEASITGLSGGTTYHERILGENAEGPNASEDIPFTTLGPTVTGTEATAITETSATLTGIVDPNGSPTTYRFQYLPQAQWEASGWAGATEAPAGGASLGEGIKALAVSQTISGLTTGTSYRMRILAESVVGTTEGAEVEFTADLLPFAGLPDGRAWEQASPVDKNGADVQGGVDSVQASLDGDRITFFSNTGIPGGEGAQSFPTFMASRSSEAWTTEGLLPPASDGPRAEVLGWSEDLADTYDFATRAFEEGKILRRTGPGALTQVAGGATQDSLAYAGSSRGGAVALLESKAGGLRGVTGPADLEGKQNAYAYDRASGELVVAGVLDDGTVPPAGAMAGPYEWFKTGSTTELGGALANYYTQSTHAISADGSEVFFTAGGTGQLYVRVNPFGTPQELTPAECRAPANQAACTIRVSAPTAGVPTDPATPAAFLGASADGRLVYFLDKGKLTADATGGTGYDLYRYDVSTGSLTDLTLDTAEKAGARVEGMLGIGGPQGEDAYFVAAGKLAAGTTQAPVGETNLYALHGSVIEFVARLGTGGGREGERLDWTPTSSQTGGLSAAHSSRVSPDGLTLLFRSVRNLTAYRSQGKAEIYLVNAGQGIICVSCNPTGEAPTGSAGVQQILPVGFTVVRHYAIMTRNLSPDGRRVFFDSPDRLVSGDHNGVNDVYEWEADGKGSCTSTAQDDGCLFLISGGAAGAGPSWFGDASESGDDVFFLTAQPLVAQDKDELVDVYDARVGGGIASQNEQPPPPPCEARAACRGPIAAPPAALPAPDSEGTLPGNPTHSLGCKKGQVKKHDKCVKKQNHKKKKGKKHHRSSKKKHGKGKKGGKA